MNLYNDMKKRTRNVIRYIEGLEIREMWNIFQIRKFNKIIENALKEEWSNDKRLQIIGYRVGRKRPRIYDWINGEKKDELGTRNTERRNKRDGRRRNVCMV